MSFKRVLACTLCLLFMLSGAHAAELTRIKPGDALPFEEGVELMYVYFFDISAQDSFLVRCGGETMLIDCGTYLSGVRIAERLARLGITHIDYALNTHPHDDHINGFCGLIDHVNFGEFLTCFAPDANPHQITTLKLMEEMGVPVVQFTDADDLSFGGNRIWLYQDEQSTNTNYRSLVMHLSFGDASVILLSDIGRVVHAKLLNEYGEAIKADIMKLPHHGLSVPGSGMTKAIDPEICVLTNWNNSQSAETLKLLKSWKYPVAYSPNGTLEFITDGKTWVWRQYAKIDD